MVATLEAWCRGDSQIPAIHWDGMAVVSLTGTLACAFLATLCPDHPVAALHSLAGLLAHGHHGEVVRRCGVLLDAHSQQSLELRLTRALAWVLSRTQVHTGVADYLQAFMESTDRTVAFIHTHQQPYLPALVRALQDYISEHQEAGDSASQQVTNCQGLLVALDPGGIWSITLSPEALLQHGRYEDCRAACSRALEAAPTGCRLQGRHALHTHQGPGQKLLLLSLHCMVKSCLWWGLCWRWGHHSDKMERPLTLQSTKKENLCFEKALCDCARCCFSLLVREGFLEEASFELRLKDWQQKQDVRKNLGCPCP